MSTVSAVYSAVLPPFLMAFLAVQDSSIDDLSQSVSNTPFDFRALVDTSGHWQTLVDTDYSDLDLGVSRH